MYNIESLDSIAFVVVMLTFLVTVSRMSIDFQDIHPSYKIGALRISHAFFLGANNWELRLVQQFFKQRSCGNIKKIYIRKE